jgi:hypothetical protein
VQFGADEAGEVSDHDERQYRGNDDDAKDAQPTRSAGSIWRPIGHLVSSLGLFAKNPDGDTMSLSSQTVSI